MKLLNSTIIALLLTIPTISFAADKININTANEKLLAQSIKGVGERKAEAITLYRERHGDFKSVDELSNVKGISHRVVEEHREILVVSD